MKPLREVSYKNHKWHCRLEFFPERIEYEWDKWGFGVEKNRKVIMRDALSPYLSEGNAVGAYMASPLIRGGLFATLAVFSLTLLPTPWHYLGYFFIASTVLSLSFALRRIGTTHWLSILKKDGDVAVGVHVTKWSQTERDEFKEFYRKWAEPEKVGASD
ncbi:MAG: hypothetical protein Q8M02_01805 [Candidatus Didemnitutus sp.]|nr:hypothetical protein [Candidatus Didemnitutus sp.]